MSSLMNDTPYVQPTVHANAANSNYYIVPFVFKQFHFRTIIFNNDPYYNPWFINKEICDYLGIVNSRDSLHRANLLDFEKGSVIINDGTSPLGGNPNMTIISESGLYKIIANSRKPEAIDFQNWLYSVVLPSIRRYGAYIEPEVREQLNNNPNLITYYNDKINEYENQVCNLQNQITNILPHANVGEFIINNMGNIPIEVLAKIFNASGIDIGRNRLFELLRKDGYLMKHGTNRPTQKSMDMGIMSYTTGILPNGSSCTIVWITPKGIEYFINKYKDYGK